MGLRSALPHSLALLGLGSALLGVGCGHPATRAECDVIFDKSAEIELRAQNVQDPKEIATRIEAVRKARGEEIVGKCVGRRITERAMQCVRQASSAAQVDKCLE